MEVHIATAISEPPPRSPIHILESSRAVQWCVRVCVCWAVKGSLLWVCSSSGCTREWEKDPDVKLETGRGEGGWMEGLGRMWSERADLPVSNGWHTHTHTHTHTRTHRCIYSHTPKQRCMKICSAVLSTEMDWVNHTHSHSSAGRDLILKLAYCV